MKKNYVFPETEATEIDTDVITSSTCPPEDDGGNED